jgi:putative DNA primase/helicase
MSAEAIARGLGKASRSSGEWWRCPCPIHGGSSALVLKDGDRGLIAHCHAGCAKSAIYNELRRLGLLDSAGERAFGTNGTGFGSREEVERVRRKAAAMDLWGSTYPAKGSVVARYWRSRGIVRQIPPTIRMRGMWHGESGERRPAMLALVEHAEHGRVAVHCTFLAIDGSAKATIDPNRKFFGPVRGGAVRLGQIRRGEWLVIGEGIETTAAAMDLFAIPSGWAALSAGGMRNLVLPRQAERIVIAVDNDEVGRGAARDAAWLWQQEGRTVRVALPPTPGTDFDDVIRGAF